MNAFERFKFRKVNADHISSSILNEVSLFKNTLVSHEFFSELGSILFDLLKIYDVSEAIKDTNKVLSNIKMPHVQSDNLITKIPSEGILIDKPGTYKFSPSSTVYWSPNSDVAAAIIVLSDNVTLDLQQSTLAAEIQDSSKHFIGIAVYGVSNVTIMNGTFANMCLYGIQAELVEHLTVDKINISGLEYKNTNIRNACPTGIQINTAKHIKITDCRMEYFYTTEDSCSGIQFLSTLHGEVTNSTVSNLYNYAGGVSGFSYVMSCDIKTKNCHATQLQSHFGCNIRAIGHTVLGFIPVFCEDLEFENCSSKSIIGSCDDCHGMSVFLDKSVTVKNFQAENVTDGVTQFNTGAKATGLEVYGLDISVSHCRVSNIRAINPQDKLSTGFSVCGKNIALSHCSASNVSVSNNLENENVLIGTGTGFGWAPDPRLYFVGATNVAYQDCQATNCQVGFDTWNHIDSTWNNLAYDNCAINILVEPGGVPGQTHERFIANYIS